MTPENCTKIGQIVRTHGINGAVIWKLEDSFPEEFKDLESVFVEIDNILVPFFIASYKVRNTETAIVQFDDIDADSETTDIMYKNIFVLNTDLEQPDDDELTYAQLIGLTAYESKLGKIGPITGILQVPQNELFEINYKGEEVLVPINEDWIVEIDTELKRIELSLPEGLLTLNDPE